jgi:hypothetical protein
MNIVPVEEDICFQIGSLAILGIAKISNADVWKVEKEEEA